MTKVLTPIEQAIQIIEKISKNLTNDNEVKDLKAIANQFKTELLPKEDKYFKEIIAKYKAKIKELNGKTHNHLPNRPKN